jgi:hypothetical protein
MVKPKKSPTGAVHKEPVEKHTRQGQGRRSKASHGRKLSRGQGK